MGKPGSDLAAELGVTAQDDVLFAVFRFFYPHQIIIMYPLDHHHSSLDSSCSLLYNDNFPLDLGVSVCVVLPLDETPHQ